MVISLTLGQDFEETVPVNEVLMFIEKSGLPLSRHLSKHNFKVRNRREGSTFSEQVCKREFQDCIDLVSGI